MHADPEARLEGLIPVPVQTKRCEEPFTLTAETVIRADDAADPVARWFAERLRPPTGYELPVADVAASDRDGNLTFSISDEAPDQAEGYRLTVDAEGVRIEAGDAGGIAMGVQTLRQLLPAAAECRRETDSIEWTVPGVEVVDYPRFGYRGVLLDVARHFFPVEDVERLLDLVSLYKINHLHLHLTDNTGWRIEIGEWPDLTGLGAATDIDGGSGGYYTAEDYGRIVEAARQRGITVVPEIDVPAHVGAAVTAYPALDESESDRSLPLSRSESAALDVDAPETESFLADVVGSVAEMTPGSYFHFGGDEVEHVSHADYAAFLKRVVNTVEDAGKVPVGWGEVAGANVPESTVVQYWKPSDVNYEGYNCILSPRNHAYLNFRYDEQTPADGPETWGRRRVSVRDAYDWEPDAVDDSIDASAIRGVEAAFWSEEIPSMDRLEFMAFPRLPGIAERGWSEPSATGWEEFAPRLGKQARRWHELAVRYYPAPEIPWAV